MLLSLNVENVPDDDLLRTSFIHDSSNDSILLLLINDTFWLFPYKFKKSMIKSIFSVYVSINWEIYCFLYADFCSNVRVYGRRSVDCYHILVSER